MFISEFIIYITKLCGLEREHSNSTAVRNSRCWPTHKVPTGHRYQTVVSFEMNDRRSCQQVVLLLLLQML